MKYLILLLFFNPVLCFSQIDLDTIAGVFYVPKRNKANNCFYYSAGKVPNMIISEEGFERFLMSDTLSDLIWVDPFPYIIEVSFFKFRKEIENMVLHRRGVPLKGSSRKHKIVLKTKCRGKNEKIIFLKKEMNLLVLKSRIPGVLIDDFRQRQMPVESTTYYDYFRDDNTVVYLLVEIL